MSVDSIASVFFYKAMAPESPRSIRLKRAAQLLEDSNATVSEAAFQTGFSELKYFRMYFKKQFGCLPSEYGKKEEVG